MKNWLLLLLFFPTLLIAQVGINTTTPNAALDIQSTSNGVLIPRVQLTDALDVTTVVNPAGGALPASTLVYNKSASGITPNEVIAGFYYWNGLRWTAMTNSIDHDWYEEGTTTPPDAITDNMFHTGNVAIGKNTANTALDIETTDQNGSINNNFIKNLSFGTSYSIDNTITINANDDVYGMRNSFFGTGTGAKTGLTNFSIPAMLGSKTGISNNFTGNNADDITGVSSLLVHNNDGRSYGIHNNLINAAGSTGIAYGMLNTFNNNSTNPLFGVSNEINSNTGTGGTYAISNSIQGGKTGGKFGVTNNITSSVADSMIGISNTITSTVDGGNITGLANTINANSDTAVVGNYNQLGGSGNNNVSAVYSFITNSGDGEHTGIFSNISGGGIGRKYGTSSIIEPTAGGQHFGVFARVLKPGANYAGYFNGKVAIGSSISFGVDDYVFPVARGTNGQIMQTDGSGNLSWQNPASVVSNTSWSINGNSSITSPANPVTYGTSTISAAENFLGTTNATDVTLATDKIERMRIKNTTGNVGIGTATPLQPLHVYKNSNATKSAILGQSIQTSTSADFQNRGLEGYGSGTSGAGGYGYGIGVMGIGDRANSYFATGVFAHLGSTTPNAPITNQALLADGNSLGNAAIFAGGNVGIGTPLGTNPSNLLHVNSATNGAVRIVDGTEGNKKVLTSNATGVATWQPVGIDNIQADLTAVTGITISYTNTVNYLQTGASITLPPGRYAVNVNMLLSTVPGAYTNSNEAFWVRSTFSDSNGVNPISSPDIVGSALVSGNLIPSTLYSLITGMVVINNTTAGNKTYYYVAGRVVTNNSTRSIAFFGGSYWAENNIIAYRLN